MYTFLTLITTLWIPTSSGDSCPSLEFWKDSDLNNLTFERGLIHEKDSVHSTDECVALCIRESSCNMALFNSQLLKCRLYQDVLTSLTDGVPESGWTFLGASCESYRLKNGRQGSHVLDINSSDLCADGYQTVCQDGVSCMDRGSWWKLRFKCIQYLNTPLLDQNPTVYHRTSLDFDLTAGMKVILDWSTDFDISNRFQLLAASEDSGYMFRIRWHLGYAHFLVRKTKWIQEGKVLLFPFAYRERYILEIRVLEDTFETYVDGVLLMINARSMSLAGARDVTIRGAFSIYRFEIIKDEVC